ncbi:MAG: phospholipid carrier-dependent glycosyltransferase, partial [Bacillota bacterium]
MSKKFLKVCLILVVLLQLVLATTTFAQGENIVKNAGFEEGSSESIHFWSTNAWDTNAGVTQFTLDETQYNTGTKSACIINNSANDSRYKQPISVKGSSYYKMSCWIKTENVGTEFKGANLSIDGSLDTSRDIRGTSTGWEYVELYGITSKNQESFTLTVGLGGYGSTNTGKAWFDDVEVVELDSLPPGKTAVNLDPNNSGTTTQDNSGTGNNNYLIIAALVFFALLLAFVFFMVFKGKKTGAVKKVNGSAPDSIAGSESEGASTIFERIKVKFDKTDFIIMGVMTLIYLVIALYNLGDLKVPTTSWLPSVPGESFTVDLGKNATLSRVYFYCGLGSDRDAEAKLRVEYLDESQNFKHLATIEKKDIFIWKYIDVAPVNTNKLKFIVDVAGGTLNEIGIVETGSTEPIKNIKVIEKNVESRSQGSVENLFDESDKFAFRPSYKNSMYFDEIYHARTAFEFIHRLEVFETTHPPLGKVFIALGVLIFGMVPFGWRIVGTLFGVAMVPVMYAFGKKVFHKRFFAFSAAFLMMFDSMHFSQTRISTIDSYVTLFVILMYYYMYDYFMNKSYVLGLKDSLKPLFLSGLFFGLGVASKWIALYGAAGLALLFFINKIGEFIDYERLVSKKSKKHSWIKNYPMHLTVTLACCVVFFIIIPGIIYFLSYIPWMQVPGPGHGIDLFIRNSRDMLNYHKDLVATHPYQSAWWEWPIMVKPMAFYFGSDLDPGMASKIFTIGNPAVWWVGILAFFIITVWSLAKLNKNLVILFTLSTASFAYVALPKSFISAIFSKGNPDVWWIVIFAVLMAIILALSKFDLYQIITAIVSASAFSGVVFVFKDAVKDTNF